VNARARLGPDLTLVAAAFLFSSTFLVIQDATAADQVGPAAFLAARFGIAVAILGPFALRRGRPAPGLGRAGLLAGLALAAGMWLQVTGLQHTTTSVSAFLTYLLVVFVPLGSAVVLRRPPLPTTLAGVAVAVVGLALLVAGAGSGDDLRFGLGLGEALTLACALAFAAHIVVLGAVAGAHDPVQLNAVQCAVVAVVLGVPGALEGGFAFPAAAWAAAAWTGLAATAVAFGLQIVGQRRVSPSRTALLLMLEPVFAGALGYAAGERLGAVGLAGAATILLAIVVSEVGGARTAARARSAP
jgi:drug/metabolite transporter (DMT)-like permease